MSTLEAFSTLMLPPLEEAMQQLVRRTALSDPDYADFHEMIAYHMGWEGAGAVSRGKRLRPLLLLLCCAAAGGDWRTALPAAAAVELLHNFSLIHDDIEDNSPLRRGLPTVWSRWGIPQAINAGDALYSIAHLSIFDLKETCSPKIALEAAQVLQQTCLKLTQGQYLDMSFESQSVVKLQTYWHMIGGKTAALVSTCCDLGALCAEKGFEVGSITRPGFRAFGEKLGLAFQVQDDILGIWGDSAQTGKSAQSDLVDRKKSLPILFGIRNKGAFAAKWREPISLRDTKELMQMLENEGALTYAQDTANQLTSEANAFLQQALSDSHSEQQKGAGEALRNLTNMLLTRQN